MKRRIKWVEFLAAGLVLLFIFGRAYLVVDEKPEREDVVIARRDVDRIERATVLYHAVYTKEKMLGMSSDYHMREVKLVFDQL